jgi:hypothetical protein
LPHGWCMFRYRNKTTAAYYDAMMAMGFVPQQNPEPVLSSTKKD